MILIGIGSNLGSERWGPPRKIAAAALSALEGQGVRVLARSRWYESEPVPASDQPWFVNGVASLATALEAAALLSVMQAIETRFGRVRAARNAARLLDLDLLDHDGAVIETPFLVLPHSRLHERRFALVPLAEVAPAWRHPVFGASAAELLTRIRAESQPLRPLPEPPCGDCTPPSGPL